MTTQITFESIVDMISILESDLAEINRFPEIYDMDGGMTDFLEASITELNEYLMYEMEDTDGVLVTRG